jgi:hypothetical protein
VERNGQKLVRIKGLRQCSSQEHAQTQPCNMKPKSDQIRSNNKHIYVENYAKINNLTSIYFNYQRINTILSK